MSPAKVAICTSGSIAPAPAIICWHVGSSASALSAAVAADCTGSSSEPSSLTSGFTAPLWQISRLTKLSASLVGSSIARAYSAFAARNCRRGSTAPSTSTIAETAPPATAAERNIRACSGPAWLLPIERWIIRSRPASFELSEPCCKTAMTSVSASDISRAMPARAAASSAASSGFFFTISAAASISTRSAPSRPVSVGVAFFFFFACAPSVSRRSVTQHCARGVIAAADVTESQTVFDSAEDSV